MNVIILNSKEKREEEERWQGKRKADFKNRATEYFRNI